ncbi:MAG: phosphate signaling complex protein PhoU [Oscillospiraceae bacterium]|nr:phosphate signaling complex protein PhoU [Oscillospiraceae bacterium]
MRIKFEEQLAKLNDSLINMGNMVKEAISNADKALIEKDTELAKKVIASDDEIDQKEREIEKLCLKIIMQQQPVARDLWLISSVLKTVSDLERIGDHASDISEITLHLADTKYRKNLEHISQMAEVTMEMVVKSIDSFVKKDQALANEVIACDDRVDDLFKTVKKDSLELISKDVNNGDQAIDLIMIAKYFERIGDHATNVAEWVIFSLTGQYKV